MAIKEFKQDKFYGGMTDLRGFNGTNVSLLSKFDLGNYPDSLIPIVDVEKNSGGYVPATMEIGKLVFGNDNIIYGLGKNLPTDLKGKIFALSSPLDSTNSDWTAATNGTFGGVVSEKFFSLYKTYIYAYDTSAHRFSKYGPIGGSPTMSMNWATPAANSTMSSDGFVGKDDNLYVGYYRSDQSATVLGKIDGTNLTELTTLIPNNLKIVQMCSYGNYMAIICAPHTADQDSVMYLWDYSSPDVIETIPLGEGTAVAGENMDGSIIVFLNHQGFSGETRQPYIRVLAYSGGSPVNLKRLTPKSYRYGSYINTPTDDIQVTTPAYNYGGNLYFGGTMSHKDSFRSCCLFRIGKKMSGYPISYSVEWLSSETTDGTSVFDFILYRGNKIITTSEAGVYNVYVTENGSGTTSFADKSIMETCVFNAGDSSQDKLLHAITVNVKPAPSYSNNEFITTVFYKKDYDANWSKLYSDSTYGSGGHTCVSVESDTRAVTMTIASPAVFTLVDHNLNGNQIIKFNTTGALPTGILPNTEYYVSPYNMTKDTFRIRATASVPSGTDINTSGTQSGTHTIDRTQPLPIFKEIQFRVECTGGVEVTGIKFKYEELQDLYGN